MKQVKPIAEECGEIFTGVKETQTLVYSIHKILGGVSEELRVLAERLSLVMQRVEDQQTKG